MKSRLDLQTFLESRGRPLSSYGSGEHGLVRQEALHFLDLLKELDMPPLGVDVWRSQGSQLTIEGLDGWYPDSQEDVWTAVRDFLVETKMGEEDLFTIQF